MRVFEQAEHLRAFLIERQTRFRLRPRCLMTVAREAANSARGRYPPVAQVILKLSLVPTPRGSPTAGKIEARSAKSPIRKSVDRVCRKHYHIALPVLADAGNTSTAQPVYFSVSDESVPRDLYSAATLPSHPEVAVPVLTEE